MFIILTSVLFPFFILLGSFLFGSCVLLSFPPLLFCLFSLFLFIMVAVSVGLVFFISSSFLFSCFIAFGYFWSWVSLVYSFLCLLLLVFSSPPVLLSGYFLLGVVSFFLGGGSLSLMPLALFRVLCLPSSFCLGLVLSIGWLLVFFCRALRSFVRVPRSVCGSFLRARCFRHRLPILGFLSFLLLRFVLDRGGCFLLPRGSLGSSRPPPLLSSLALFFYFTLLWSPRWRGPFCATSGVLSCLLVSCSLSIESPSLTRCFLFYSAN